MKKIAVPSEEPGGLAAAVARHFGHCDVFTVVHVDGEEIEGIDVLSNAVHAQGGCVASISLLERAGADTLVVAAMGPHPLSELRRREIPVYFTEGAATVHEAVRRVTSGTARRFGSHQVCRRKGSGGGASDGSPN